MVGGVSRVLKGNWIWKCMIMVSFKKLPVFCSRCCSMSLTLTPVHQTKSFLCKSCKPFKIWRKMKKNYCHCHSERKRHAVSALPIVPWSHISHILFYLFCVCTLEVLNIWHGSYFKCMKVSFLSSSSIISFHRIYLYPESSEIQSECEAESSDNIWPLYSSSEAQQGWQKVP